MKKSILFLLFVLPISLSYVKAADSTKTSYTYKNEKTGSIFITNKPLNDPHLSLLRTNQYNKHNMAIGVGDSIIFPSAEKVSSNSNLDKFYKAAEIPAQADLQYLKNGEDIKIIETSDNNETNAELVENSYKFIGASVFKDWNLSTEMLKTQARKVRATVVVFSKHSNSTVSYTKQDDPNNLDFIYNYRVDFYVKDNSFKAPNMLGLSVGAIPLNQRNVYQRNTGTYIRTVVKGSKAYQADILSGDVIIEVNGVKILEAEDFNKIKEAELSKTKILNLKIIRLVKNEPKEIVIPVNFE